LASTSKIRLGEAQAAESRKDFIHTMKIILKELRETSISFKILSRKGVLNTDKSKATMQEVGELIAIFTKSIETAEKNS
jgi:four helix bundle protein